LGVIKRDDLQQTTMKKKAPRVGEACSGRSIQTYQPRP
jgi:hypothetical protein